MIGNGPCPFSARILSRAPDIDPTRVLRHSVTQQQPQTLNVLLAASSTVFQTDVISAYRTEIERAFFSFLLRMLYSRFYVTSHVYLTQVMSI